MRDLTDIVTSWANDPYITHDDVTKCGLCWQQKIQSDVCKEFLANNSTATSEDLHNILAESRKRWRETALYKRVTEMLKVSGKTLADVEEELRKEDIEL